MKHATPLKLALALSLVAGATGAYAHGAVSCPAVPKEEKRAQTDLQKQLEGEGWKVRQVKNHNNCYEVYATDAKGKKVEAFFHAKTFERVYPEGEKPEAK